MSIQCRNVYRDGGDLVALTTSGELVDLGPAHRTFYLAPDVDHAPPGWRCERSTGDYLRCERNVKAADWKGVLAELQTHCDPLEADVHPVDRALADRSDLVVAPQFLRCAIDIETADVDRARLGDHKSLAVVSFAFRGSDGKRGFAMAANESPEAEKALLEKAARIVQHYDVLVAWNGGREWGDDGFDFPVLRERMKLHAVPCDWWRAMCLDQMVLFKKHFLTTSDGEQRQSFALDAVGRVVAGVQKVPLRRKLRDRGIEPGPAGILAALRYAPELLEEYNRGDVDLQWAIEEKTGFLALHFALCSLVNCLPRSDSLTPTRIMDALMMRLGSEYGHHWPTRDRDYGDRFAGQARASGAAVMPVVPGLSENVSVLDVGSLYPSLIRALNLGPDTKVESTTPPLGAIIPLRTDMQGNAIGGSIACFRGHDRPGQLPRALERVLGQRKEFETALKKHPPGTPRFEEFKRLSNACKVAANSMYGIVLQQGSRYYDPDVGESVTNTGRLCIRAVVTEIERRGHKVILQDTDSAAFVGDDAAAKAIIAEVNERVFPATLAQLGVPEERCRAIMQIKYEETYARLLQVATKKYAGIFSVYRGAPAEGEVFDVKGLECVKGDTVGYARRLQREIVERVLRGESSAALRALAEERHAAFMNAPLEAGDVLIHQTLTKPIAEYKSEGPHVVAAKIAAERGIELDGGKVAYWMAQGGAVELAEDFDPARVDRTGYWDDKIWPPTQRVLAAAFADQDWRIGARGTQAALLPHQASPPPKRGRKVPAEDTNQPIVLRLELGDDPEHELRDRQRINRVAECAQSLPGPRWLVVEVVTRIQGRSVMSTMTTKYRVAVDVRAKLEIAAQVTVAPATLDLFSSL